MSEIRVEAYGATLEVSDNRLIIRASNSFSKAALGASSVELTVEGITGMKMKPATPLSNGALTLGTSRGKIRVHFRKKQESDVARIQKHLAAKGVPEDSQVDSLQTFSEVAEALKVREGQLLEESEAFGLSREDQRDKLKSEVAEGQAAADTKKAERRAQADAKKAEQRRAAEEAEERLAELFAKTAFRLSDLGKKEMRTLVALSVAGEAPWLVINPDGFTGFLAAFSRELVIVKTGGLTAIMSGAMGGARVTHFPYAQITGIEYNSGMMNGVLEILTASYEGTKNKDYWRGSTRGRNADSNDPFTLSNTLPMRKHEYGYVLNDIQRIRERIHEAHTPVVNVTVASPTPSGSGGSSLAEEITRLNDLRTQGLLSDDEFEAAKARVIGG